METKRGSLPYISIIIPCYNEEKYIESCIVSILSSCYPIELMEIIIVDGGSDDNTINLIASLKRENEFIKLLHNPFKTVPIAMNQGIREAKGEYIIRLDAHSNYPSDYFSKLIEYAKRLDSDNIGGVCITDVKIKNNISISIKEVLSNRFGIGNSLFRTGVDRITEVDTVVFGCFKSDVFTRFGYYDERLIRNQDIELNKRIKRGGGKLFLVPEIICTYYARETFAGISKNNFQNGLWNILTVYYTKTLSSLSFRHFIPLIFLLSLFVPAMFAFLYKPLIYITLLSFVAYFVMLVTISVSLFVKKKINPLYLIASFSILHISYGAGSLIGLMKLSFIKCQ